MNARRGSTAPRPPLIRCLAAGLAAGVVGAVLAAIAAAVLQDATDRSFEELSTASVARSSLIGSVLGSLVYYGLARWTARPALIFAIIALVVATLLSIIIALAPPHPGFAAVANPLHYIVAVCAAIVIPIIARLGTAPRDGDR